VELVRELGADHVIDYTTEDFTKSGQRYDVILDLVGNRTLTDLRRSLTPKGTLILSGGGVSKGGSLFGPMGPHHPGHGGRPLRATEGGGAGRGAQRRQPGHVDRTHRGGPGGAVLDRTYPLERAADAIRYLEVEHAGQGGSGTRRS
jgi:hypothetical protein